MHNCKKPTKIQTCFLVIGVVVMLAVFALCAYSFGEKLLQAFNKLLGFN